MRFGSDLDMVVFKTVPSYLQVLGSMLGKKFAMEMITCYSLEDSLLLNSRIVWLAINTVLARGRWPLIEGASEHLSKISQVVEAPIVFISSRSEEWRQSTRDFLWKTFRLDFDLVLREKGGEFSKAEEIEKAGLDWFVEDCGETAVEVAEALPKTQVCLFTYLWNEHIPCERYPNLHRVNGWLEVWELVNEGKTS